MHAVPGNLIPCFTDCLFIAWKGSDTAISTPGNMHFARPVSDEEDDHAQPQETRFESICRRHMATTSSDESPVASFNSGSSLSPAFDREKRPLHPCNAPREPCITASGTADIAFFLKNTGPPSHGASSKKHLAKPIVRRKSALAMFKRKKDSANYPPRYMSSCLVRLFTNNTSEARQHEFSESSIVPCAPHGVEKKTLSNGKPYSPSRIALNMSLTLR